MYSGYNQLRALPENPGVEHKTQLSTAIISFVKCSDPLYSHTPARYVYEQHDYEDAVIEQIPAWHIVGQYLLLRISSDLVSVRFG